MRRSVLRFIAFSIGLTVAIHGDERGALDKNVFANGIALAVRTCCASGTVLIVARARDVPEAKQLRKLLIAFQETPNVTVVQIDDSRLQAKTIADAIRQPGPKAAALVAYELPADAVHVLARVAESNRIVSISTSHEDIGIVSLAFDRQTSLKMFYWPRANVLAAGTKWPFTEYVLDPKQKKSAGQYADMPVLLNRPDCCGSDKLRTIVTVLRNAILVEYEEQGSHSWPISYFPHYDLGRAFFHMHRCDAANAEWEISEQQQLSRNNSAAARDVRRKRAACR